MTTPPPARDRAKARFFAIQAMRFTGLGLVMLGLLIINRKLEAPEIVGYALFLVGLFDALFMPTILARRWKSPPP